MHVYRLAACVRVFSLACSMLHFLIRNLFLILTHIHLYIFCLKKLPIISFIFQESNKNDPQKSNELFQHKSEMSYYVPPSTQVSHEPISSPKIENISDEDEYLLHSSTTMETIPKKEELIQVIIFMNK